MDAPQLCSATHRCLLISELLNIIVEFADNPTLASLSRTCKMFNEAAVPEIWRFQESLVPLLRLLPADTWIEVPNADGEGSIFITNPGKLKWTRFNQHAQYVRVLYWREKQDVSPLTLSAIMVCRSSGKPLLPHLKALSWYETRPLMFSFVHHLLTPTINTLNLSPAEFPPLVTKSFFDHAGTVCKDIENLCLFSRYRGAELQEFEDGAGDAFVRFLKGQRRLVKFTGQFYLSAKCVEALAALPNLTIVHIYLWNVVVEEVVAGLQTACNDGWFDALELLALEVAELDWSTQKFLGAIQGRSLEELWIQCYYQPDTNTVKQHTEVIRHSPYHDSLTTLQLEFENPPNENMYTPPVDVGEALRALYALPGIDSIVIRSFALTVSGAALRDMTNAWHRLQVLSLISYQPHSPENKCISLVDLVPLAQNCVFLCTLEVHLDATNVPDDATLARLMPQQTKGLLQRIVVIDAPLVQPAPVAAYLTRLFPCMCEVEYWGVGRFQYDAQTIFERNWDVVQEIFRSWRAKIMADHATADSL
ncbi:hypothetical protein BC628DRAFT_1437586 [Trametes gibbosa]|nr:hypothetical protein BC628DRAFT_1437586 [Trametes gibbosa]